MAEFAEVLSRAVDARGLTLERIRRHLELRGVQVSLSTLSYWRRGRSRPERPESLNAVAVLEQVLKLAPGELTGNLGDKRPRGRWTGGAPADEAHWQAEAIALARGMAHADELLPAPARYLSVRDTQVVGPDRRAVELRTSAVIMAAQDGVDRILVSRSGDTTDRSPGTIRAEKSCRIGRVRVDDEHRVLVAEVVLDRVLRAGETALVDLVFVIDPGADSSTANRRFVRPLRDYVLEVEFHPDAVPPRCHGFARPGPDGADVETGELWIGTTASTHLVVRDARAGAVHGVRWEWE